MNSGGAVAAGAEPSWRPPLALNGTASVMWRAGDDERVIRLTDGGYKQVGSAWSTLPVDLNHSFETRFTAHIRNGKAGADGIAFVVQGEGPRALGGWGGGMGYRGIHDSVAVEFDTFQNPKDPDDNHLAVVLGGNPDWPASSRKTSVPLKGKPFHARVHYDAAGTRLRVYVRPVTGEAEQLVIDHQVELADRAGVDQAWIGFTGATGDLSARQDVYSWSLGAPQA
ncbi:L-type lectin-domain containing protein [Actinoplanes sp. NEAU-A12]|uniref:L-type lectin-domain containing protein n=1 Tax=Actinoplanes sandaracinus TaxID=3045177 RepID=A0ABT6WNN2_9ACTN|nr:L-type lectin-domain containing protein [Actinoplanes sandaracinus]MDI6101348.1 L-type lectin-domain containing protein [Actinoplanes sandaracinus]